MHWQTIIFADNITFVKLNTRWPQQQVVSGAGEIGEGVYEDEYLHNCSVKKKGEVKLALAVRWGLAF